MSFLEHSYSSRFEGTYERGLFGTIDGIGTQILQERSAWNRFKKTQLKTLQGAEELNDDECGADYDGDKDFDVGGEGQPYLKRVL